MVRKNHLSLSGYFSSEDFLNHFREQKYQTYLVQIAKIALTSNVHPNDFYNQIHDKLLPNDLLPPYYQIHLHTVYLLQKYHHNFHP